MTLCVQKVSGETWMTKFWKKNKFWTFRKDEIKSFFYSFRHVDASQYRKCTGRFYRAKTQLENRFNFHSISVRTREEREKM